MSSSVESSVCPGQIIQRRREFLGLKQIELARLSNVNPRTLDAIEKGRTQIPSISLLKSLAKVLNVSVAAFFAEVRPGGRHAIEVGNQKGLQTLEFARQGFRVVCYTPMIPDLFVGKVILDRETKITRELLPTRGMIFVQSVIGRVSIEFDGSDYLVREGHYAFFNGEFPHTYYNPLLKESSFLLVTVPSFLTRGRSVN